MLNVIKKICLLVFRYRYLPVQFSSWIRIRIFWIWIRFFWIPILFFWIRISEFCPDPDPDRVKNSNPDPEKRTRIRNTGNCFIFAYYFHLFLNIDGLVSFFILLFVIRISVSTKYCVKVWEVCLVRIQLLLLVKRTTRVSRSSRRD